MVAIHDPLALLAMSRSQSEPRCSILCRFIVPEAASLNSSRLMIDATWIQSSPSSAFVALDADLIGLLGSVLNVPTPFCSPGMPSTTRVMSPPGFGGSQDE